MKNILAIIGLFSLCGLFIFALQDAQTDEHFEKKLIKLIPKSNPHIGSRSSRD
mgnify:CR=1 FL=1